MFFIHLGERAPDERVLGIDDGRLGAAPEQALDAGVLLPPRLRKLLRDRQLAEDRLYVPVALKVLDGEVAGRIAETDVFILADNLLQPLNTLLDLRPVVDVDMASERRVGLLIDLYHGVEKFGDAAAVAADRRADRDAEKIPQLPEVHLVALRLEFVVHIERHHRAQVHIDDLRREIEVSLDIRSVHDVDDNVRGLLYEVFTDIQLLGAVGREGIRPGEIHENELVAAIIKTALLGVHRHTAVVADVLMCAGGDVEQGCLAAVGVADEGDTYLVSPLLGDVAESSLQPLVLRHIGGKRLEVHVGKERLPRILVSDDLYGSRFLPPERDLVSENLVLDGILQGSVQDNPNLLPLDKPHLYQPLTKAPVTTHADDHSPFPSLELR